MRRSRHLRKRMAKFLSNQWVQTLFIRERLNRVATYAGRRLFTVERKGGREEVLFPSMYGKGPKDLHVEGYVSIALV